MIINRGYNDIRERKIKATFFEVIASGTTTGTITVPANGGATLVMDEWGTDTDALLSTMGNGKPTFKSPVDSAGNPITTTFDVYGNFVFSASPSPAADTALIYVYTCNLENFTVSESLWESELLGDAVLATEFDAHSVLAATTKNTPFSLNVGEDRIIGRISAGNIAALTPPQIRTMLNVGGGADVEGPASALDTEVPVFDGITGKKIRAGTGILLATLNTLTDNSMSDTLHRHSELSASDGTPDQAVMVNSDGDVRFFPNVVSGEFPEFHIFGYQTSGTPSIKDAKMWIDNWGNLNFGSGIGTAIASYKFQSPLRMNDNIAFRMGNSNDFSLGYSSTNDQFVITDSNTLSSQQRFVIERNGNIGIGTISPATSAKLELASTTGALLLTRMTTAQKNALTPVNGMVLYDSTLNQMQTYENGAWRHV